MTNNKLEIKGSRVLDEMIANKKRFILSVGGSRSSKTYSAMQWILIQCFSNKDLVITIARKTFPSLRKGAYREFIQMLKNYGIYNEVAHNRTNHIYTLCGNLIQFISLDQSIKLRGLKHDIVFIDEINEIEKDAAEQIFMRTTGTIIMCQNPTDALHWSLDYKSRPDCHYIHSTFKDNPFLDKSVISQIKSYKLYDGDLWRMYGLGLPAKNNELIYSHWQTYERIYESPDNQTIFGLDFGFNHPTALIEVVINRNKRSIWCRELIYKSFMTTNDLISQMKSLCELNSDSLIFCDSAEPKTIEEIKRAGFDARGAMKEVKEGIDLIKSFNFYIHSE
ncbi:MAG: PBSX family phage terminase large subunit, partial [Micrococcales bacterium]|nr:PBSX family phage terminase large subunit [Micrococcales bacterium]